MNVKLYYKINHYIGGVLNTDFRAIFKINNTAKVSAIIFRRFTYIQ